MRVTTYAPGGFQPWADRMRRLARETHLECKLSGLLTEAPSGAQIDAIRPFVDHLLDTFGAERLLWGSDWPVLTLAASYGHWFAMSGSLLSGLTAAQQDLVLGTNAARFYRLHTGA